MKRGMIDLSRTFAVASAAALLFLALKVSSNNTMASGTSYELVANFENIGGLKVRAPIKSAGVVVGRVSAIELDPSAMSREFAWRWTNAIASAATVRLKS